jgi:4-hydroxy-tetrahydrodipicolinate reductase
LSCVNQPGSEVRVIFVGVGYVGSEIARLLLKKKGVKIVGAVDPAPEKVGRDLGEVIGLGEKIGVTVLKDIADLNVEADVAIHATTSFLEKAYPQIIDLVKRGLNVISTCEELSYPYIVSESIANEIDDVAKKHRVTVLGAGINPGFLMDTLVMTLTALCQDIKRIVVERVMDASKRRLPFQRKIGAGLSVEEFRGKVARGEITGHVGLRQSIAMVADALGVRLENILEEAVEPVIAEEKVESNFIVVKPGYVAGVSQRACGILRGEPFITLIFKAYIGAAWECDSIFIEGTPTINERIVPCVHGDIGTAAVIVNLIPKVIDAQPGLRTMKDMQVPSAVLGDMRLLIGKSFR